LWKLASRQKPVDGAPVASFGRDLDLLGVSARFADSRRLIASLYWRAVRKPVQAYTVFVQVLSPSGGLLAQHDSYPLSGRYPTSLWDGGEHVLDKITLQAPQHFDAGESVIVGLYVLPSVDRLLTTEGQPYVTVPIGSSLGELPAT
jgi:hypothetical protein